MDIMSMTAVELGRKIKAGELSAEEAVEAAFLRIEKTEKDVHGFLSLDKERALKQARQVQKQIKEGTMTAPLAGVPAGIKDNLCTAGMKTTCASRML